MYNIFMCQKLTNISKDCVVVLQLDQYSYPNQSNEALKQIKLVLGRRNS